MTEWMPRLTALALLVLANTAPWAAGRLLRSRGAAPLDCGATLADGSRLLGDHKTWRGLIAGALACGLATQWLGQGWALGIAFGALSLAADAASSFVKRRLRRAPGTEIPGLDQLPEALLPLGVLSRPLGLPLLEGLAVAIVFLLLDLAVMRMRHR
jgi:CDP-diglyceride synthetase